MVDALKDNFTARSKAICSTFTAEQHLDNFRPEQRMNSAVRRNFKHSTVVFPCSYKLQQFYQA